MCVLCVSLFGCSVGVLTVASGANFDFETAQTVVVDVVAQDSVDPPGVLSSSATITIEVVDVNDNSPEFQKNSYAATVDENKKAGTTVVKGGDIVATDKDTGVGGDITYSIVSSNPSTRLNDFIINNSTGTLM